MVFVLIRMRVLNPYDNLPISVALECVHSAPSLLVRRVPITHILPVAGSSVAPAKSGGADGVGVLGKICSFARCWAA